MAKYEKINEIQESENHLAEKRSLSAQMYNMRQEIRKINNQKIEILKELNDKRLQYYQLESNVFPEQIQYGYAEITLTDETKNQDDEYEINVNKLNEIYVIERNQIEKAMNLFNTTFPKSLGSQSFFKPTFTLIQYFILIIRLINETEKDEKQYVGLHIDHFNPKQFQYFVEKTNVKFYHNMDQLTLINFK